MPLRSSSLSVCPCGDPWGTLLQAERTYSWAPVKPTKVTSAKGRFCAYPTSDRWTGIPVRSPTEWKPLGPACSPEGWSTSWPVACLSERVRCGVVWCGAVRCGAVRRGIMVWYGMVWYVWYGMVRSVLTTPERPQAQAASSSPGLWTPPEQLLLQPPPGLLRVDGPHPIAPQPRHVASATRVPSPLQSPPSPVPAARESASEQLPRRPPRTSTCFQGKNERRLAKVLGLTTWGAQPREEQSQAPRDQGRACQKHLSILGWNSGGACKLPTAIPRMITAPWHATLLQECHGILDELRQGGALPRRPNRWSIRHGHRRPQEHLHTCGALPLPLRRSLLPLMGVRPDSGVVHACWTMAKHQLPRRRPPPHHVRHHAPPQHLRQEAGSGP